MKITSNVVRRYDFGQEPYLWPRVHEPETRYFLDDGTVIIKSSEATATFAAFAESLWKILYSDALKALAIQESETYYASDLIEGLFARSLSNLDAYAAVPPEITLGFDSLPHVLSHYRGLWNVDPLHFEVTGVTANVGIDPTGVTASVVWPSLDGLEADIQMLRATAVFVQPSEVRSFLLSHPNIVPYLQEGLSKLQEAFGEGRLSVALSPDPDGGEATLFGHVSTNLGLKEAFKRLRAFDEKWYSQLPLDVRATLNFDFAAQ